MTTAINFISERTGISARQVTATTKLLDDGSTIPFISRYRKEATGSLNEVEIQAISMAYENFKELEKRKEFIIQAIEGQGLLSNELKEKIKNCIQENELEDLYLPYKPKRRTKAEIARKRGLEPLAKIIMAQNTQDINKTAIKYKNEEVQSADDAISGAADIIAEWISENQSTRNIVRNAFEKYAVISCKVSKGKEEEAANYQNYFDYSSSLKKCNSYRILAMRRGEKENLLQVSIDIDKSIILEKIERKYIRSNNECSSIIKEAIADSYKRLIKPSIENEFATLSKENADSTAIALFADNARQLLFAPPLGHKRVLAIDPGYRTGCKIVCLDEQGNLLHNDTIYPTPPKSEFTLSAKKLSYLIEAYKIDAIALGNGTASRETEKFLQSIRYSRKINIYIVSEDGASIYSASKIAREEFPDKDVTVRGAVSIGRRLLDPLAELVKIDPKSIGVGQYQHDVDQNKLKKALEFTVESCVNSVGVNINTASKELLTYISGLGPQLAQNIVTHRAENGDFTNKEQLLNVPRLGIKAYQQCAGFVRVPNSENPLDNTAVHPENYNIVNNMAKNCNCSINELISNESIRKSIDLSKYTDNNVGLPTLNDIMQELEKPGRDPRKTITVMQFEESVKSFEDLKTDMVINGIVTNITQFGVFVDIGIKENGLIHISELSDSYVSNPSDIVKIHQQIKVRIKELDEQRKRIALSMKGIK